MNNHNNIFYSQLKIIGYFPPIKKTTEDYIQSLIFDQNVKSYIPTFKNIFKQTNNQNQKYKNKDKIKNVKVNPINIIAQGNTIALIDQNYNAWILSQIFQFPINLSTLIKKKVKQIFLNQKQVILLTSKGLILINWGAKKLINTELLVKIPIYDHKSLYQNFFEAFSILDVTIHDKFYITNLKKLDNSNKMYRITDNGHSIISYPLNQKFTFDTKIVGMSIAKFHALCWDQKGNLFSWGTRSLGSGFQNLPDQDIITNPQKVNLKFKVKSAVASNHYSLALCPDGILYEWGIRKQVNQINQQLIFTPKRFQFRYFNCQNKQFTCLKGKNQKFGILSFTGQLYVWGQKARTFIDPKANVPRQWQNGRLYEPYLVRHDQNQKIIDFAIQQNYLSIITTSKNNNFRMKEQIQYMDNLIHTVRNKFQLKKYKRIRSEQNKSLKKLSLIRISRRMSKQIGSLNKKQLSLIQNKSIINNLKLKQKQKQNKQDQKIIPLKFPTARDDHITHAFYEAKFKQNYIKMAKSQQRLFTEIMQPIEKVGLADQQRQISKRQYKNSNAMISIRSKIQKRFRTQNDQFKSQQINQNILRNVQINLLPDFLKNFDKQVKQSKKRKMIKQINFSSLAIPKKETKSYQDRLKQVLQKKKNLQQQNYEQTLKRLEQNSLQFRMKRHLQIQMQKQRQKNKDLLKNTLFKFLIKNYLVKLTTSPLALGRSIKIDNFARNLKLQRIQKNIRKIFTKAKVRFGLKKLKTQQFSRFALLVCQWRKYVKYFRQKKLKSQRKLIVQQIIKYFTKQKIQLGLYTSNLNIRKIQKFRQWLVMIKNQRLKCLKYLWKINVLNSLKIASDNQNIVVYHIPKNISQITFQSLYLEKVQQNPNLKLINFLNKTPLFRIKVEFFSKLTNLFSHENDKKPKLRSQKIIDYLQKSNKRSKIKFFDQQQQKQKDKQRQLKINLLNIDIYPYSLHSHIFIKPKNYQISIPQQMKTSQKWIKQQKRILQDKLLQYIRIHQKNLIKRKRQYDLQLAHFIKSKYQFFCQKRWKFIIQYNQIDRTITKIKKEKQLLRLMDLIGMKRLIQQDCLPEKQAILDQATKRKDAPKPPNHYIVFGQKQFRQLFKYYYDQLHLQAKIMRKIQV